MLTNSQTMLISASAAPAAAIMISLHLACLVIARWRVLDTITYILLQVVGGVS